ncbi:MAG: hypothetical protein FJZ47_03760 [Candidatus Tectomicrobia bacterium]|uniref:AAA+ ATPase domain-containing protein n=1 Tax=Tectimicrobiota bacterium TaxID=2528274 RepID=A0A937VXL2_UNCTE|nr:hypothetical protein [Candidatus Tectomicrobia bacterium]
MRGVACLQGCIERHRHKGDTRVYLRFFNLRESPFNLTPDPRFLFLSAQHEEALTHLLYGIYERKGFIEITGEVGTGKTVLCRALLERLDANVATALIFNSYLNKMELLQAITDDFGLHPCDTTSKGYIDALNAYLLGEFTAGRNAVVVIDEAQNLEATVLEQLRMLSNLETERGKLLQIILVGQPELRDKLATSQMRQLEQRIAVRFHIHALTRTETEQYITHRMSVAGASHTVVWSRHALQLIHYHTGGIPRRINLLCDRMLMTAFVRETHRVSAAIVRQSVRDLASPWQPQRPPRRRVTVLGGIALGLVGVLGGSALLFPTVSEQWYARLQAQLLALSQPAASGPALPLPGAPEVAPSVSLPPLAPPASEPDTVLTPLTATPALPPPAPPMEVDIQLVQTLWRTKIQLEERVSQAQLSLGTTWEPLLVPTLRRLGFDVMAWETGLWPLVNVSRPCLIELLPEPTATRPVLVVLVRGLADGAVIYQEPEGLLTIPLQRLRQLWSGQLYLTLETTKARGVPIGFGVTGERVRGLQQTLRELGYFTSLPSGQFDAQTVQAVKRFQRDNQLTVDGRVGRRTLMMLLHIGAEALASST